MKVQLLERGRFVVTTEDGKDHKGRFCAGAIDRFCISKGLTHLTDFYEVTGKMLIKDFVDVVIVAMEYEQETEGLYKTKDVMEWVDDMGGILSGTFIDFMNHFAHTVKMPEQKKIQSEEPKTTTKRKAAK